MPGSYEDLEFRVTVLTWVFEDWRRAAGVLGGLVALGLFAVSRVGAEPKSRKHRRKR